MAKRFNNTLYYCERIAYVDRKLCYVQNEEGSLIVESSQIIPKESL